MPCKTTIPYGNTPAAFLNAAVTCEVFLIRHYHFIFTIHMTDQFFTLHIEV